MQFKRTIKYMKVVCLGSGNVATHLARAFKKAGITVVQVWSRNGNHAEALASEVGAQGIVDLQDLDKSADLYVIAVKDDAIRGVSVALTGVNGLVVHTSGATSINVLSGLKQYGVLYPLQTFSKEKALDLSSSPMCIEAASAEAYTLLEEVASWISTVVYRINSHERQTLHLAAVFACNFTNQLYHLAFSILKKDGLAFDLLKPLIMETASKVQTALPAEVQTGPAVRNDVQTMNNHLEQLKGLPDLQEVYETLSKSIKKTHI
jgi:predicted short-subunit dehydrogenase-like oxidoreductase (DUF2520 family)